MSIGGVTIETGSHVYWRCDSRDLGVIAVILCPPVLTPHSSFKVKTVPLLKEKEKKRIEKYVWDICVLQS